MRQLIENLISAMEYHVEQTRPIHSTNIAIQAAKDALLKDEDQEFWIGVCESLDRAEAMDKSRAKSPTFEMTLGERIAHVGGIENAAGYVEFGSPMAVNALIMHVLRDINPPVQPAQRTERVDARKAKEVT